VKLVQVFDRVLYLIRLLLGLLEPLGGLRILAAVDEPAQRGDLTLPHGAGEDEDADFGHHVVCSVLVALAAKGDDLLAGLADVPAPHAGVGVHGGRSSDVAAVRKTTRSLSLPRRKRPPVPS